MQYSQETLCWSFFLITLQVFKPTTLQVYEKVAPTHIFSCEYCKIFKNTYFEKYLRTAASVLSNIYEMYSIKI